jgi:hypothetical protein
MEVASFTPQPLYPQGKSPWYPLDRRLGGRQIRSGCRGFAMWKCFTPENRFFLCGKVYYSDPIIVKMSCKFTFLFVGPKYFLSLILH